jgi:hypothetical protein
MVFRAKIDKLKDGLSFANIVDGDKKSFILSGEITSELATFKKGDNESYSFTVLPYDQTDLEDTFNEKLVGNSLAGYKFKPFIKNDGSITLRPKKYGDEWAFEGEILPPFTPVSITLRPGLYINSDEKSFGVFFTIMKIVPIM